MNDIGDMYDYDLEYAIKIRQLEHELQQVQENNNGWISVKDRLPERGTVGRYLVYVENIANYHRLPDNVIVATWFMSDWDFAEWEYNRVTHWQSFPEPPRKDNNES